MSYGQRGPFERMSIWSILSNLLTFGFLAVFSQKKLSILSTKNPKIDKIDHIDKIDQIDIIVKSNSTLLFEKKVTY